MDRIEFSNKILPQIDFIKYNFFTETMALFDIVNYSTSIKNIFFNPSLPNAFELEVENYDIANEICKFINNTKQITKYREKYEVRAELYNNRIIIHLLKFLG